MSLNSGAAALIASGLAGILLGVAVYSLLGRRETVADRVSAYVTLRHDSPEESKSLIERALGDKQTRKIVRSPLITRQRLEMEVADINIGLEQLAAVTLLVTIVVGWLLYASTHSPVAALLGLFMPVLAQLAVRMRAGR